MLNKIIIGLLIVGAIGLGFLCFKLWELDRAANCTVPVTQAPKYCWDMYK